MADQDVTEQMERLEEALARENATVEAAKAAGLPDGGPPQAEELPPSGDARREKIQRRAEQLIAEAERLRAQLEIENGDPSRLRVENEVGQATNEFNEVFVSHAQNDQRYVWIFRDPYNEFGGRFVRRMQALGWKVVQGTDPEAAEHKHVDGTRVVADCLLMKMRLDQYLVLQKRDRLLREAQQAGIYANVFDIAEGHGVNVWDNTNMPDFIKQAMGGVTSQRQARALGAFHRGNRTGKFNRMLKEGSIPGLPPGVRRVAPPSR